MILDIKENNYSITLFVSSVNPFVSNITKEYFI